MNVDLSKLSQAVKIDASGAVVPAVDSQDTPSEEYNATTPPKEYPPAAAFTPEPVESKSEHKGGPKVLFMQRLLVEGRPLTLNRVLPVWEGAAMRLITPFVLETVLAVMHGDGRLVTAPGCEDFMYKDVREKFLQLDYQSLYASDAALKGKLKASRLGNVGGRILQRPTNQPVGLVAVDGGQEDWDTARLRYQPLSVYEWLDIITQLPGEPSEDFVPMKFWVEDPEGVLVREGFGEEVVSVTPVALPIAYLPMTELLSCDREAAWEIFGNLLEKSMEAFPGRIFIGRVNPAKTALEETEFTTFPLNRRPCSAFDDDAAGSIRAAELEPSASWLR